MAGAYNGVGEVRASSTWRLRPSRVYHALQSVKEAAPFDQVAETASSPPSVSPDTQLVPAGQPALDVPFGIVDLSFTPTLAGDLRLAILGRDGPGALWHPRHHGGPGSLNDAVKKGGRRPPATGGLSGAFIPVSEDEGGDCRR